MEQPVNAEEQFLKAYDDFADAIFRHCFFRINKNRELAKDLTQETFLRAWTHIVGGGTIKNIRPFLYKVASNLIIDSFRGKRPFLMSDMSERAIEIPVADDSNKIEFKIEAKKILKILEQIGPIYRDAVLMRYMDDLSPKEIAEILGESENAVSVRIHRGIQKLREIIKQV